jgi:hypothetical protein
MLFQDQQEPASLHIMEYMVAALQILIYMFLKTGSPILQVAQPLVQAS